MFDFHWYRNRTLFVTLCRCVLADNMLFDLQLSPRSGEKFTSLIMMELANYPALCYGADDIVAFPPKIHSITHWNMVITAGTEGQQITVSFINICRPRCIDQYLCIHIHLLLFFAIGTISDEVLLSQSQRRFTSTTARLV